MPIKATYVLFIYLYFSFWMSSSVIHGRCTYFVYLRLCVVGLKCAQLQRLGGFRRLTLGLIRLGLFAFYFNPYSKSYERRRTLPAVNTLERHYEQKNYIGLIWSIILFIFFQLVNCRKFQYSCSLGTHGRYLYLDPQIICNFTLRRPCMKTWNIKTLVVNVFESDR